MPVAHPHTLYAIIVVLCSLPCIEKLSSWVIQVLKYQHGLEIFIYSFSVQPPEMWELEIYRGQDSQHSCRACYRGQYMGTMIYGGQCMGGMLWWAIWWSLFKGHIIVGSVFEHGTVFGGIK